VLFVSYMPLLLHSQQCESIDEVNILDQTRENHALALAFLYPPLCSIIILLLLYWRFNSSIIIPYDGPQHPLCSNYHSIWKNIL